MQKVRVLVERGPHAKVASECFDYELPVLQELHSVVTEVEGGRSEYKPPVVDGVTQPFDVGDAFRALHVKYNQPDAQLALNRVYRSEADLARAISQSPAKKKAA